MRDREADRTRLALVADGSGRLRELAAERIERLPGWRCETAATAREARDRIVLARPAVLVLDAELEGNEGGAFAERLLRYHPMPVILVCRKCAGGPAYAAVVTRRLEDDETAGAVARAIETWAGKPLGLVARPVSTRLVAIGASTGGTEAVERVLSMLPEDGPGVVIAQHIPRMFSASFAARLNRVTRWEVREAAAGDVVRDGVALVAPGDQHMRLARVGDHFEVRLDLGPKMWHQRPAVDILFSTVARAAAGRAVGVLLTGMGEDGARGLFEMRQAGCWTIGQDEASCVVYGMPRAAAEAGAVCEVRTLDRIAAAIAARFRD